MKRLSLVVLLVLAACEPSDRLGPSEEAPPGASAELRAAYIAARQAEGASDSRFHLTVTTGHVVARSVRGLEGWFDGRGVELRSPGIAGRLEPMSLRCGGRELGTRQERSVVDGAAANRLHRSHGPGVTEWWVNGPLGLEQGFDLDLPDCSGEVAIDIATSGLPLHATAGAVRLGGSLIYGELYAADATGAALPARLGTSGSTLEIRVDASRAVWPIRVDPLIYTTEQKVALASGGDAAALDVLGSSVALSADTALIGAPNDTVVTTTGRGSVYVFARSGTTWSRQAKLVAADGAQDDRFGSSVALSGDTAVVGAPNADIASANQGAAYVFTRAAGMWTQEAKLVASDGVAGDLFGASVAVEGDQALVGASMSPTTAAGAAYVYTRSATTWSQRAKLAQAVGGIGDQFGMTVALSGDTALVGAQSVDVTAGGNQGRAFVFRGAGAAWSEEAQLTAGDVAANDNFGRSVALSGDTALVGAPNADVTTSNRGAAYVFVRSGTAWSQQQKLVASDGDANDNFGASVALLQDTALVGAPGADAPTSGQGMAYAYTRSGTSWTQQAGWTAPAADIQTSGDYGRVVALATDMALIGSPLLDGPGGGTNHGAAFVRTRSGVTWSDEAKLTAGLSAAGSFFGSVALSADTAVVGATYEDLNSIDNAGGAHVFARSGAIWSEQQRLVPSDPAAGDSFGFSVDVSGDTALVGAYNKSSGRGAAYVFTRSGSTWTQQAKLEASDGVSGDSFAYSVALEADTALIGAFLADGGVANSGTAYVFVRSGTSWSQQAKINASDAANGDYFGFSVALSSETALIGAREVGGANGAAYVFVRSGTSWSEQQRLAATPSNILDYFGRSVALDGDLALIGTGNSGRAIVFTRVGTTWSQTASITASGGGFPGDVALSGDTALIGANTDNTGAVDRGAAFVFTRSGSVWTQETKLLASDGYTGDRFGTSVAIDGTTILVGASSADNRVYDSLDEGAAYFGLLEVGVGSPCGTATLPCSTGNCVDGVCCDTACGGGNLFDCMGCSVAAGASVSGTCTLLSGRTCNDGVYCNGSDTCAAGACSVHTGNPCPGADGDSDCTETCNEAGDNCNGADPDGSGCSDSVYCNGADTCAAGQCTVHAGNPCPGPDGDGDCAESCNEAADACTLADVNGASCADGLFCNGADTCSAGACSVHAGDPCPGPDGDDDCAESCDEGAGSCTLADTNGSSCSDGLFCNGAETCTGGACGGSSGDPCPGPDGDGDCAESCDEAADNCLRADTDGASCADGIYCNGGDTCAAGVCGVHAGDPCPGPDGDGDCAESCDEGGDSCTLADANGSSCDDMLFCNGTDACSGGVCGVHAGDPCPGPDGDGDCAESCDEGGDSCTLADVNGSSCTEGLYCNGTETCTGGACAGSTGDPCPGPDGDSNCAESCDENADSCAGADANGSSCDDGLYCNGSEACSAGAWGGSSGDPCAVSIEDGDADCREGCDEAADACAAAEPDGTACVDTSVICSGTQSCNGGACICPAISCPGADGDGDCSESYDPSTDTCTGPDPDASACDDGLFCNGSETCSAGLCQGSSGDPCPTADDDAECNDACDEAADACTAAEPNGTVCLDPAAECPGAESCTSGACSCPALGCPGPDGDADCAESYDAQSDTCTAPDPDGASCDDGLFCNGTETCSGGVCGDSTGDPCPGADGDDDCVESCDEATSSCGADDAEGSVCDGGVCDGGSCIPEAESSVAAAGCGCKTNAGPGDGLWLLVLGLWSWWRRARGSPKSAISR